MLPVTALSAYLYCPRKLFLERVLRLIEPPKSVLVKGSIRHKTHERINLQEHSLVNSIVISDNQELIHKKYIKSYLGILRNVVLSHKYQLKQVGLPLIETFQSMRTFLVEEATSRAITVAAFKSTTNLAGEELWKALTPKIKSEIKLESHTLGLRGIIDQIEIYEDKKVPIELKTGKTPDTGMWSGHKLQLAAYIMLLEEHLKEPVKFGKVRYLDSGKEELLCINPMLRDEVIQLTSKVKELLSSKALPVYCENKNKCSACGIKQDCYNEALIKLKTAEIL